MWDGADWVVESGSYREFCDPECEQAGLLRMSYVDNKRYCPTCGRIHKRTGDRDYFKPIARGVPVPRPRYEHLTYASLGSS